MQYCAKQFNIAPDNAIILQQTMQYCARECNIASENAILRQTMQQCNKNEIYHPSAIQFNIAPNNVILRQTVQYCAKQCNIASNNAILRQTIKCAKKCNISPTKQCNITPNSALLQQKLNDILNNILNLTKGKGKKHVACRRQRYRAQLGKCRFADRWSDCSSNFGAKAQPHQWNAFQVFSRNCTWLADQDLVCKLRLALQTQFMIFVVFWLWPRLILISPL